MDDELVSIGKALGHPLRIRYIRALAGRSCLSPSEFAWEFDEPLGNVSYHARILLDVGVVEVGELVPRRGAVEHRYRLAGKNAAAALAVVNFFETPEVVRTGARDRLPRIGSKAVGDGPGAAPTLRFADDSGSIGDIRQAIEWRLEDVLDAVGRLEAALGRLDRGSSSGPRATQSAVPSARPVEPSRETEEDGRQPDDPDHDDRLDQLLMAIRTYPGASSEELADRLGLRTTQVSILIAGARARHLVLKSGDGYVTAD